MVHRTSKRLATGGAVATAALALAGGAAAADRPHHPDDRATHGVGAIEAERRAVVLRPDDRADRGLPGAPAVLVQPAAGGGFDWVDAGIGASATLGLVLLVAGGSVIRLRHRAQPA
jgi:hypothetical protein